MTISGKHELQYHWNKPVYNNKPSWNSAPQWAMWLAMDGDGSWWWYGGEPVHIQSIRIWNTVNYSRFLATGHTEQDVKRMTDWEDSLERRPINEKA